MASRRLPGSGLLLAWTVCGLACDRREPTAVRPIAAKPEVGSPTTIEHPPAFRIAPGPIRLNRDDPGWQLLVEGVDEAGGRKDWTGSVAWEVEPSGIVEIGADGYARPLAPGKAEVRAVFGADRSVVPLEVVAAESPRSWDFAADVAPLLTRHGCNGGGCHGRAAGRGGLKLSFLGYDPAADYQAIVRDRGGARIDPADAESSLLLQKATETVPHGGKLRFDDTSTAYETLRAWIAAGAPERLGKTHGALAEVKVDPAGAILGSPGTQQFRVMARYADGTLRDVTRLASFRATDDSAVAVNTEGLATLKARAEADVVVRYGSTVLAARLGTPLNSAQAFDFAGLPRRNVIDRELFRRLEAMKVPPSPRATDTAFLRRVCLDLVGHQPTPDQVRRFLNDADPEKRARWVDRLLEDRDFVRFWKIKLGDLFQVGNSRFGMGTNRFLEWIDEALTRNRPWDDAVRTLLTAVGDPTQPEGAAANYALDGEDAPTRAEGAARRFLGLRIRCARCHDHPFDVWTQDDYYGLAAFFAKVRREGGPGRMGRSNVVVDPKGIVTHLRTGKPAEPRLPGGETLSIAEGSDPRAALAAWITGPENPYFARAVANWAWAQFFGKGIADPPDDLSRANPPVHPELLDALAKHFIEHKYDLRDLLRLIATSEAYGLSSATVPGNAADSRMFSHQRPRPLTAQQMADALAQVTDVPNVYAGRRDRRALDLNDATTPSTLLDAFGRCPRVDACSPVSAPTPSLRQALLVVGPEAIEAKVQDPRGYLTSLMELEPLPPEVVENLYLRALCRHPSEAEAAHWSKAFATASSPREAAEDLLWSLLNSREFAFNH